MRSLLPACSLWLFVLFNSPLPAQGQIWRFDGDSAGDHLGASVSGAGDVDGDGYDDVIVGATGDDNHGTDSGSARVFSGRTGAVLFTFDGDSAGDQLGYAVSGAGDVDGDGFADVIVGARQDLQNGSQSGSAYVFTLGCIGTPARSREYGAACQGSNLALPRIGIRGRPALGSSVEITLRAALPTTTAVFLLGSPIALSLDLIGMSGCSQYASTAILMLATTDTDGMAATPSLSVPNESALIGTLAACQWTCFDAAANSFGLIASNGLELVFGN